MENGTARLEDMPKIGIFECFLISLKAFCGNLMPFLKMLNPIYHITLATCVMIVPVFIAGIFPSISPKGMLLITIPFLIAGIAYLFYSFWQYLIGLVAVSYLAKDILENKEIKTSKDYYSYVKQYGKSYGKYWLWICLFWLVIVLALFLIVALSAQKGFLLKTPTIPLIFTMITGAVLLWPLSIGLGISYLFWAYGEKQDNLGRDKGLEHIIKSIKLCYTDPLRCVGYFLLLGFIVLIISTPIFILLGLITYAAIIPVLNHTFSDPKTAEALVNLIVNILQNFVYYIMSFFTSFAATKFYFNFIKSNN